MESKESLLPLTKNKGGDGTPTLFLFLLDNKS